ncbi:hypothetical protein BGZ76_000734 [Entomortierella beljakovae]|nr:hypothetical protein BGZ76_000734 [Entomortierella beljakovae]
MNEWTLEWVDNGDWDDYPPFVSLPTGSDQHLQLLNSTLLANIGDTNDYGGLDTFIAGWSLTEAQHAPAARLFLCLTPSEFTSVGQLQVGQPEINIGVQYHHRRAERRAVYGFGKQY